MEKGELLRIHWETVKTAELQKSPTPVWVLKNPNIKFEN